MLQTLIDISIQEYGNPEAVAVLIDDNPMLFTNDREFELTADLPEPDALNIREEDDMKDKKVMKELNGKVIVS
jgi:hypothetical protein